MDQDAAVARRGRWFRPRVDACPPESMRRGTGSTREAGVLVSSAPVNPKARSRGLLLVAAMLFSTGGAAIKATALNHWQVASFRSGIAALAILALVPAARRIADWRSWLVGVAYAACLTLYVTGNKLTTAANTIFLQSTAPVYLVVLGPLLLGERVRRRDLVFMAALAAGMACFFLGAESPAETAPNPFLGNLVAAAAGVAWAFTVLGLRWLGRGEGGRPGSAMAAVVCGNLLAFFFGLPWAFPVRGAGAADAAVIVYLGVIQIGLAYAFMTRALRDLEALETSLLLLIEPVLNPVWALLLHGEVPSRLASLGGAVILVSTGVKTWFDAATSGPSRRA